MLGQDMAIAGVVASESSLSQVDLEVDLVVESGEKRAASPQSMSAEEVDHTR
jgi:hypothetical protein